MSKLVTRIRAHRAASRRAAAIASALAHAGSSPSLREEILTISNRVF